MNTRYIYYSWLTAFLEKENLYFEPFRAQTAFKDLLQRP
jgi:hypothetical protein